MKLHGIPWYCNFYLSSSSFLLPFFRRWGEQSSAKILPSSEQHSINSLISFALQTPVRKSIDFLSFPLLFLHSKSLHDRIHLVSLSVSLSLIIYIHTCVWEKTSPAFFSFESSWKRSLIWERLAVAKSNTQYSSYLLILQFFLAWFLVSLQLSSSNTATPKCNHIFGENVITKVILFIYPTKSKCE